MNDLLSWCRHLLLFLFHDATSLHPSSFHRNAFSTCSNHFSVRGKAPTKNEMFCALFSGLRAACVRDFPRKVVVFIAGWVI